jgi:hypothetical protein
MLLEIFDIEVSSLAKFWSFLMLMKPLNCIGSYTWINQWNLVWLNHVYWNNLIIPLFDYPFSSDFEEFFNCGKDYNGIMELVDPIVYINKNTNIQIMNNEETLS